ncbi:cobalamin B12-binding domain-containing protein [Saccharothrix hoggarensis]
MSTTTEQAAGCALRLWDAVVDGDEDRAAEVVLGALAGGLDAETVLLDVVGAVQRRVGAEWAANHLTVAQEHAATAINERVVSSLAATVERPPVSRGRITVSCVDGEWHALPARLLAEVLKLRGFRVDYLGAQVPAPHLITHLHSTGPDAVALSGSLATRLPTAHATITACQATGVPVVVGGAAFGPDGRYARLLGADVWAPDARAAADRLSTGPLPRPRGGYQPIDHLPHLGDQEYTMVSRTSGQLVKALYTGLERRIPAMASYTELQRQHTAEDLAHIVDFFATALYTDDDALFTGFLTWTADVLGARGVPAGHLLPALALLATELHDFPRARRILDAARDELSRALSPGPAA